MGVQTSLDLGDRPVRTVFYFEQPGWDDRAIEADLRIAYGLGQIIFPQPRYALLKAYNGASGEERRFGGNLYYAGVNKGIIPKGRECTVCRGKNSLGAHNENYFRPCNARPVCQSCHRLLHRRFWQPNPWLAVAFQHKYPGAWFANIGLSELSREQAIYLAGLDDPFDVRQLR